jgi:hypothetical protein
VLSPPADYTRIPTISHSPTIVFPAHAGTSVPDPHVSAFNWSSGSGSRRSKKSQKEEKNAAKRQIIRPKKYSIKINVIGIKCLL